MIAWKASVLGFDLVITDLRMPAVSGKELIGMLRELAPTIPVLAMSGYPEDNLTLPNTPSAPARFIAKPFTMEEMVGCVGELTAQR
jgi:FixJ family two-component response regulator